MGYLGKFTISPSPNTYYKRKPKVPSDTYQTGARMPDPFASPSLSRFESCLGTAITRFDVVEITRASVDMP
jgi:hypothetical protein